MISNKQKAVIHVAKSQIGMSEDEYRDLLDGVGVQSSTELTGKSFNRVMSQFERMGFKSTSRTRKKRRKIHNLPTNRRALMKKLEAMLLDMDLEWAYVDAIAQRRFGVDRVQWLGADELRKVVQMIVIHQKRRKKNA